MIIITNNNIIQSVTIISPFSNYTSYKEQIETINKSLIASDIHEIPNIIERILISINTQASQHVLKKIKNNMLRRIDHATKE